MTLVAMMSVPICTRIDPLDGIGPHFSGGRSGNHPRPSNVTGIVPEPLTLCTDLDESRIAHPRMLLEYPQQGAASYRHAVKQRPAARASSVGLRTVEC
jgi:hypothetical protein